MTRRAVVALLLVVSLAGALLAGALLAAAAQEGGAEGAGQDYSLEELRDGGKVVDERYPSVRVATDTSAMWLVSYPPSGFNSYGESGADKEYLTPDTTVRRNKVRLFGTHPFDGDQRSYNLTIVYWKPDTREVQTENGTTTERYANVTGVDRQEVRFDPGMQQPADVQLRGHYDEEVRVTIWAEEYPDRLRWTFRHESIALAQPVNIDNTQDLISWGLLWIVMPTLVLLWIVGKKVPQLRRAALAGPGRDPKVWILPAVLIAFVTYLGAYVAFASLIAALPLIFPLFLAWVAAAILLEDDDDQVERWGFLRVDPERASSPIDEAAEILDAGTMEIKSYEIVKTADGEPAIYHRGIRPFYARLKGKVSVLKVHNQEAEFEGVGDYDKVVVVSDGVEEVVQHEPETVVFTWPWRTYSYDVDDDVEELSALDRYRLELDRLYPDELDTSQYLEIGGLIGAFALAGWISWSALGGPRLNAMWGVLAVLPFVLLRYAEPIDGAASTKVAPGQARKAFVTAFYADLNMKRFATVQTLARALMESENRNLDVQEWVREVRDEGLLKKAHGDGSPFETVSIEDDPALAGASAGRNGADAGEGDDA